MQVSVAGRHLVVTDDLREHIQQRLEKLQVHFEQIIEANVVLIVEKHRHIAEVSLYGNGFRIHSKESSNDMVASVDGSLTKLEKQVQKFKDRTYKSNARKKKEGLLTKEAAASG